MTKTSCVIRIDGKDISSAVLPRLLDLTITDKAGASSDTCDLKLDDTDGQILLPRDGVKIEVRLGDASGVQVVFTGTVDEPRSSRTRSEGQTISISAKGIDSKGKAKQPQEKHWDDASLGDVMSEAASDAGIGSFRVDPDLAKIRRPYWAMQNESFLHFAERIAREVGGTFKVQGSAGIMVKRSGGRSASGSALPAFQAKDGVNLIGWDIAPTLGRPRFKKVKVRHYDKKTAVTKTETVDIGDDETDAEYTTRYSSADEDEAKALAGSAKTESERTRGGGTVTVNGSADPQPECEVVISGARPGIDGSYRIETVTHTFSTGAGWTTQLDLKQPHGSAGKDKRKSKKSSSSGSEEFVGDPLKT